MKTAEEWLRDESYGWNAGGERDLIHAIQADVIRWAAAKCRDRHFNYTGIGNLLAQGELCFVIGEL